MKKLYFQVLILSLLVVVCFSCQTNPTITKTFESVYFDSLDVELEAVSEESIIPGFAVAIIKNDAIVYEKGFGYADLKNQKAFTPSTINIIASISKTFVGVAIMKLVDEGKLDLDERVNDILPYDIINPHFPETPITVRHLVTHTSTFTDDFDPEDAGEADIYLLEELTYEEDSIQAFMDDELSYYRLGKEISLAESIKKFAHPDGKWYSKTNFENHKPGTKYSYSNLGADLAGLIVEIKSGMSFDDFTRKHIFEPLKMENTAWEYENLNAELVCKIYLPNDWDNPTLAIEHPKYRYSGYPSGELKTNAKDLGRYVIEMMNGFNGEGTLLSQSAYQTLFEPQLTEDYFEERDTTFALNDEYNVGVFWAVSPKGHRLHNGGSIGIYSFMYFNPETQSGAIGYCNLPDRSFGTIRDIVFKYEEKINDN